MDPSKKIKHIKGNYETNSIIKDISITALLIFASITTNGESCHINIKTKRKFSMQTHLLKLFSSIKKTCYHFNLFNFIKFILDFYQIFNGKHII